MVGLPKIGLPKLPFGGKGKDEEDGLQYRKFGDNRECFASKAPVESFRRQMPLVMSREH